MAAVRAGSPQARPAVELSNVPLATANWSFPISTFRRIDGTLTIEDSDRPDAADLQPQLRGAPNGDPARNPLRQDRRTSAAPMECRPGRHDARLQGAIPLDNGRLALDPSLVLPRADEPDGAACR